MTSFVEKHCGSSLTLWLIIDTLLIPKLFTPFEPICSQFRLYIVLSGREKNIKIKNSDFSAFPNLRKQPPHIGWLSLGGFESCPVWGGCFRRLCFSTNDVIIKMVDLLSPLFLLTHWLMQTERVGWGIPMPARPYVWLKNLHIANWWRYMWHQSLIHDHQTRPRDYWTKLSVQSFQKRPGKVFIPATFACSYYTLWSW